MGRYQLFDRLRSSFVNQKLRRGKTVLLYLTISDLCSSAKKSCRNDLPLGTLQRWRDCRWANNPLETYKEHQQSVLEMMNGHITLNF